MFLPSAIVLRTLTDSFYHRRYTLWFLKGRPRSLRTLHRVIRKIETPTYDLWVGTTIHLFQIHFTSNTGTVDREQSSGASLSNGFVPKGTGAELIHGVVHPAGSEDSPPLARETD
ncbi:hypothetical protein TNIN_324831 [Trichonephila inaurata madagascariensis]|uniref:Uncharacterized protein n=1 Tax=Trichonephila inaurata madagascariensis TaxID=2747483 RepID=A0A8X6XSR6_9ARAC|nr:hypothetical protein TNIN_324831 [Trichonephila inaurata madagascariensis]